MSVRTAVGLLETAAFIVIMSGALWLMFPHRMANPTVGSMMRFVVVVFIITSSFHLLSVLLSTFLNESLSLAASMWSVTLLWVLHYNHALPPTLDLFSILGVASPLVTHAVPWAALGAVAAAGTVFFWAALKLVRAREYK